MIFRALCCWHSRCGCSAATVEATAANREGIARAERILALNPADGRVLALGSCALYDAGESGTGDGVVASLAPTVPR